MKAFLNNRIKLFHADFFHAIKEYDSNSIDLLILDPNFGVTMNEWDVKTQPSLIWDIAYPKVKEDRATIIFSRQPYTTQIIYPNIDDHRSSLLWLKEKGTDFRNGKRKPLNAHEDISVFCKTGLPHYNLVRDKKEGLKGYVRNRPSSNHSNNYNHDSIDLIKSHCVDNKRYPLSYFQIPHDNANQGIHPTQKPFNLIEKLVLMYSNPNDLVVDGTLGSAVTALACIKTNRRFDGYELNLSYFKRAITRIEMYLRYKEDRLNHVREKIKSHKEVQLQDHNPLDSYI